MLTVNENNDEEIACSVLQKSGAAQDVTGWQFEFRVTRISDDTTLFTKVSSDVAQIAPVSLVAGTLKVLILPIDTDGFSGEGLYEYEFKATDAAGKKVTLSGPLPFTIKPTLI